MKFTFWLDWSEWGFRVDRFEDVTGRWASIWWEFGPLYGWVDRV